MNDKIKITRDLDIKYSDLCKVVDTSHKFTLRDVINIAYISSNVSRSNLQDMIDCPYLKEFYDECQNPCLTGKDNSITEDIEYLQLSWGGEKSEFGKEIYISEGWTFDGIGKKGVMKDAELFGITEIDPEYRQAYAIEFTPVNELADFEIKINEKININDDTENKDAVLTVSYCKQITLIELFYAVFWELSFCGSPKERDGQKEILNERVDEIQKHIDKGTLDTICVPWEDVKERLKGFVEASESVGDSNTCSKIKTDEELIGWGDGDGDEPVI